MSKLYSPLEWREGDGKFHYLCSKLHTEIMNNYPPNLTAFTCCECSDHQGCDYEKPRSGFPKCLYCKGTIQSTQEGDRCWTCNPPKFVKIHGKSTFQTMKLKVNVKPGDIITQDQVMCQQCDMEDHVMNNNDTAIGTGVLKTAEELEEYYQNKKCKHFDE